MLWSAWVESSPLYGPLRSPYWAELPRGYRAAARILCPVAHVAVRVQAAHALLFDEHAVGSRAQRLKALVLIWGPVRWYYPSHRSGAEEVVGFDDTSYPGPEMTCWEATFVAVPFGLRLGRAHIYREGGP